MHISSIDTRLYNIPLPTVLTDAMHGEMRHFAVATVQIQTETGPEGLGYTYTVGKTAVLESLDQAANAKDVFARRFDIGPRDQDMILQAAHDKSIAGRSVANIKAPANSALTNIIATAPIVTGLAAAEPTKLAALQWANVDGNLRLTIPKGRERLQFTLWMTRRQSEDQDVSGCLRGHDAAMAGGARAVQ